MFLNSNLPAIIWAVLILILTLMPGKYIPPVNIWDLANLDKAAHLIMFLILIILVLHGFRQQYTYGVLRSYASLIGFLLCVGYGLSLEIMQGAMMLDREFDLFDALANGAGCVLGIIIFKFGFNKQVVI